MVSNDSTNRRLKLMIERGHVYCERCILLDNFPVNKCEQVHHINCDPNDNRLENLMQVCVPCHKNLTALGRLVKRGVLCLA